MTKQEQNAIIIESLEKGLQLDTSVQENIGDMFAAWVQDKVAKVTQSLAQAAQPQLAEGGEAA